jgi:hypothetical protein
MNLYKYCEINITFLKVGKFSHDFLSFFEVLEFELRVYTLSHSTSPFYAMGFFKMGVS